MARPLQDNHLATPTFTSFSTTAALLLVLASIATVSSIIISLCTSHKHSKMCKDNRGRIPSSPLTEERKIFSGISSKALVVAKMVSWKKDREVEVEDDEALWKKGIIMGEKCKPLEFSGRIMYDAQGNRLPEIPPAAGHGSGRRGVGL